MKPANSLQQPDWVKVKLESRAAIVLTIAALTFSACGEKPEQPPVPQTKPSQDEPAKLFEQERTVLEKSKTVDQTTEKSSEELRQEVERQAQ